MSQLVSKRVLLAGGAVGMLVLALSAPASAQTGYVPNLQPGPGGWQHPFGRDFPQVAGSALPMTQDPGHPFIAPGVSFRFGDLANPNIKQWAKDLMKKDIDEIDAGKVAFTANSSCLPSGVPMFDVSGGPFYVLQTPKQVVMIEEGGLQVRHIYMNVPHSANVTPSWFGESVGHYEGDTLVVDTIGLTTKTVVDPYRTPHTDKLHVVERWHVIEGGNMLEVNITVDDPDTYFQPWQTYQRYQRGQRPYAEFICAENNQIVFDYHMPVAEKPDF